MRLTDSKHATVCSADQTGVLDDFLLYIRTRFRIFVLFIVYFVLLARYVG